MITDTYNSITTTGEGLYKEKGSKFLAFTYPVKKETEVKDILEHFHKEYHNARHICYAYKMGYDANAPFRMNDDGEPSGTAGKPIYGQLLSHELTDILIVVVRYFGGTKLGVSGLINAYKSASNEAIENTEIIEMIRTEPVSITYDFALTNVVMRLVKDHQLSITDQQYDNACHLTVSVRLSKLEQIKTTFRKVYGIELNSDESDENEKA